MKAKSALAVIWEYAAEEAEQISDAVRKGRPLAALRARIDDLAGVILRVTPETCKEFLRAIDGFPPEKTVVLGRRHLLAFLVAWALRAEGVRAALHESREGAIPTAREKLDIARALARLADAVAGELTNKNPSEVEVQEECVVHLLAETARREFGLPAAIDVEGALQSFGRVEPALHLWHDAYRDHLLHAAEVCLLGAFLLDAQLPGGRNGEKLIDWLAARLGLTVRDAWGNWFLASMLHDVGYGVDVVGQAVDQTGYLTSEPLKQLRARLQETLGSVAAEIAAAHLADLPEAKSDGLNHGVVSYLHLLAVLEKGCVEPGVRRRYRAACDAVRKHHLKLVPVSFADEPLTALLVFCDELQEWDRPFVSSRGLAAGSRRLARGAAPGAVPSASALESLGLLGMELDEAGGAFRYTSARLECQLTHQPPELGKFWPQRLCVEKCCSLQRIRPEGFPLRLHLKLIYQLLTTEGMTEYGLEALRSYALRHPALGLVDFVEGRREGLEVVRFEQLPGNIETVSFCLDRLSRFPLLPARLEVDWGDFARWILSRSDPYELEPRALLRDEA